MSPNYGLDGPVTAEPSDAASNALPVDDAQELTAIATRADVACAERSAQRWAG